MDLKCWGEGWDLPSVDIDCLSVLSYAHFAKVPINKMPSLPRNTITGILPELEYKEMIFSRAFTIIGIFRREGYNADFKLTDAQYADTLAYLSYIEQKLRPAIIYALWIDPENYTKVTRPAYGKACGFPWSMWYPNRIQQSMQHYILQAKGNENFTELTNIEKFVYKEAQSCMNVLEKHMSDCTYFFGDKPTTLDAILYGHLGILLRAPFASTELQNHLHACDSLKAFCLRMEKFFPNNQSSPPTMRKSAAEKKEPFFKSEQVVSVVVAVSAMIVYAITSGLLTERRSKLAQHLSTYKSKSDMPIVESTD